MSERTRLTPRHNATPFTGGHALVVYLTDFQRPPAASTLGEPSGLPAWKTIPSWDVIGTADHVLPPAVQLSMAKRAGAHITRVDAGHLSMIADPEAVARVIEQAARATS